MQLFKITLKCKLILLGYIAFTSSTTGWAACFTKEDGIANGCELPLCLKDPTYIERNKGKDPYSLQCDLLYSDEKRTDLFFFGPCRNRQMENLQKRKDDVKSKILTSRLMEETKNRLQKEEKEKLDSEAKILKEKQQKEVEFWGKFKEATPEIFENIFLKQVIPITSEAFYQANLKEGWKLVAKTSSKTGKLTYSNKLEDPKATLQLDFLNTTPTLGHPVWTKNPQWEVAFYGLRLNEDEYSVATTTYKSGYVKNHPRSKINMTVGRTQFSFSRPSYTLDKHSSLIVTGMVESTCGFVVDMEYLICRSLRPSLKDKNSNKFPSYEIYRPVISSPASTLSDSKDRYTGWGRVIEYDVIALKVPDTVRDNEGYGGFESNNIGLGLGTILFGDPNSGLKLSLNLELVFILQESVVLRVPVQMSIWWAGVEGSFFANSINSFYHSDDHHGYIGYLIRGLFRNMAYTEGARRHTLDELFGTFTGLKVDVPIMGGNTGAINVLNGDYLGIASFGFQFNFIIGASLVCFKISRQENMSPSFDNIQFIRMGSPFHFTPRDSLTSPQPAR